MALALDRKAFIDILNDGVADLGATMLPPPNGVWGMPPEVLETLPGYGPDVAKNRAEARTIMEKLGYGPNKRLAIKMSTRNFPAWRDPAVILASQLKEIYIDGELDFVDTALLVSEDDAQGFHRRRGADGERRRRPRPDVLREFLCGAARNYAGYCDPEFDKLVDRAIDGEPIRKSARSSSGRSSASWREAVFRPVLFYPARRHAAGSPRSRV